MRLRIRLHRAPTALLTWAVAGLLLIPAVTVAQEAADFFRQNCMSCHTIGGGRLVGPDLKDVTARQKREWLIAFVNDPKGVMASGDAYALKLKEEAGGTLMPPVPGMSPARATSLLDLIDAESLLPKSQFAGLNIGNEPFTPADVARGQALFLGTQRLANGGPACVSCHTAGGLGSLGGGRLGPDLTLVYERLKGRKNLASWLLAPATVTMRPVFAERRITNDEILPLVAFLENEARQSTEADVTPQLIFFLIGLGTAVALFVLADALWRRRFRAVRGPLVRGARARVTATKAPRSTI